MTLLKATDLRITGSHEERIIKVTWQTTAFMSEYQAELNTGATSQWGTNAFYNFTGLIPGNRYTFNVTAKIARNPGHGLDYASVTSDSATVYTSKCSLQHFSSTSSAWAMSNSAH